MEEAIQVHRTIGSLWGICHNLRHLAWFIARQGDYAQAQALAEEAVAIAREMGVKGMSGFSLMALGQYGFFYRGEIEQAQVYLEDAVSLAGDVGHHRILGVSLSFLGNIHRRKGELVQAAQLFDESLESLREGGIASGLWRAQLYKGDLARVQGDYARAEVFYQESLQMIEKRGRRLPDVPPRLDGLGMVAALQGHPERGAQLFGAAHALREHMGMVVHPVDQAEYDQHLALLQEVLGEAAFSAAWEAGSAMNADQAIAYALDENN
jgi:tetratricopeptide (TPR) repeat protein